MALFQGEEMVDVTTPDGRTLTLPRSLVPASMIPQQQIGPAVPFTAEVAGAPGAPQLLPAADVIPSVTGGVLPQPPERAAVAPLPQNGTDFSVATVDVKQMEKQRAEQVKQQAKAEKAYAAWAASPEGKLAGVQQQREEAAASEAVATMEAAKLKAAEQHAVAEAMGEYDAKLDGYAAKRVADMQGVTERREKKLTEVTTLKTKIANFKVDRTHDSPTMAAIGMLLSALGTAINNTTYKRNDVNPALKIYDDAIDRKVAWQMADLDKMGKIYGMTVEELALIKDEGKSKLEMWNTLSAGENEKAKRVIDGIVTRSASDQTKANAKLALAHIDGRIAEQTLEAVRWGLDREQRALAEKNQQTRHFSSLKQADRHHLDDMQYKYDSMNADQGAALLAIRAKGDEAATKRYEEAQKDVRNYGVKGANNKLLLTPEGRAADADADKLEAEAAALEANPDQMARSVASDTIKLKRQKAAQLRGDASTLGAVLLRNDPIASKVPSSIAARQAMIDVIDNIKYLGTTAGRALIGKDKLQQELDANYRLLAIKGKEAFGLGAWDKGTALLSKDVYGASPAEWDSNTLRGWVSDFLGDDPDGYANRLEVVAKDLEGTSRLEVQQHSNWDGKGALHTRKKMADTDTPVGKAAKELAQAHTGYELVKDAKSDFSTFAPLNRAAAKASLSKKYPGLSTRQEAPFSSLLTAHKGGNQEAGDQLVAQAVNDAERDPVRAVIFFNNLDEYAPELYARAREGVAKGSDLDKALTAKENDRIAMDQLPPESLAGIVINTLDEEGETLADKEQRELGRRAGREGTAAEQPGDKGAKKAILDIANANYKIKSDRLIPRNSVFQRRR